MEASHGQTHSELTIQHVEAGNVIGGSWLDPQTMLMLIDGGSAASIPIYQNLPKQQQENAGFFVLKWQQIEYFPNFYDGMKNLKNPFPLFDILNRKCKLLRYILPAGNTSHKLDFWLVDHKRNEPLVVTSVVLVNIDKISHHPIPSTKFKWFTPERCKYESPSARIPARNLKVSEIPKCIPIFTSTSVVIIRQIDDNNHTNQSEYFNFCFDCISEALLKSAFGDLGSIFDYDIQRMTFLYVNESFMGERIDTTCWQVCQTPMVFGFHCVNRNGLVCQAECEFFSKFGLRSGLQKSCL